MSRLLLTALAAAVLTSSTAAAKCNFTGLAPLKPVVGDNATPPTPTTPDTPTTPSSPPAPAPTPPDTTPTKPGDTAGIPTQLPEKPPAVARGFAYHPPGELLPQDAGRGRQGDRFVYLKDIVYPLKLGTDLHPHMNSQIWGNGGNGWGKTRGPGGTECDPPNYDPLLQRDNYCEVRSNDSTHKMPLCPKGYGHQGQDIRPPSCQGGKWQAVAVVDGVITRVTGFSYLTLKGKDGTVYGYLHMLPSSVKVKDGDKVRQGQVLGTVSNIMDYQVGTTYHLHFQVKQQIKVGKTVISAYVPVYSSLIAAYRREKGLDPGIDKDGNLIVDAAVEIGAAKPEPPKPAPVPEKPAEPPAPQPAPTPAPAPDKPAEPPAPAPTPAPVPEKPAEPPKPEPPQPAPLPDKPAEPSPPAPAPAPVPDKPAEPPAPAPTPAPVPEKPAEPPKPEPPQPAPLPDKPAEPSPPAPAPAPIPDKPAEPPAPTPEKPPEPPKPTPTPAPEPPTPAPEKPAPAPPPQPEKPAEPPAPAPQPSPPVTEPPAPPAQPPPPEQQSWWQSITKKVGGWWNYLWGRK